MISKFTQNPMAGSAVLNRFWRSNRNESTSGIIAAETNCQSAFSIKRKRLVKSLFTYLFTLSSIVYFSFHNTRAIAQTAPSSFTIADQVPAKKQYSINGYGGVAEYPAEYTYNLKFGSKNSSADGVNRVVTGFVADGFTYKPIIRAKAVPYDKVIFNRKSNKNETDLHKFTGFFENNGSVTSSRDNNDQRVKVPNNTTLYFLPEYVNTMDGLINSYIVNRGTDNLFSNTNGETVNNIERVDLILQSGVTASDNTKTGFLIMERGGNDPFKVAAITGLTPDGKVASLGPLVDGAIAAWGASQTKITSTVFQQKSTDTDIKPNESVPSQSISGSYISFKSLGISANATVYGIAVFPGDVTNKMDLLGLTNVPSNTSAVTKELGGLDIMSGGGFFVEQNTPLLFSLSGNVYDDANGLTDNLINGTGVGAIESLQLYAYLNGEDGKIKAKVTVNADGSYLFENRLLGNTNYTVVISAVNAAQGEMTPSVSALPENWVATGDSYGTNNQSGTGIQSGIPDVTIAVKVLNTNITDANFGIEQLPVPGSGEETLPNPRGTNSAPVSATTFTNKKTSTDVDGTVTSIVVSFPSANAVSLTIGNTLYTNSTFTAAFPNGATILTNGSGNPIDTIKVDPISEGATSVVIPFIAVDNAGKPSLTKGAATINFTRVNQLPLSVNDVNITNKNTKVNGSVIGNDTISGDGGNTWTLVSSPTNGTVIFNTDGSYVYTPNNNYTGTDVFTYKLCDVDNDCATATVTIRINDAPAAIDDVNTTKVNTAVSESVITNDTKSADGSNIWTLVSGPTNGTVIFNTDGSYVYTPKNNFAGTDVFTYKLCDADSDCANAKVTIRMNDVPAAIDDVNTTKVNTPVNGSVIANDTKSADGSNTWTLVSGPTNGTAIFNTDGSYVYTPKNNFTGTDVFTYKLCDGDSDCANAKVTIRINDIPAATDDINTTKVNTAVSGSVIANDTKSADGGNKWSLVTGTTNGTVVFNADGTYTYTPNSNYSGTDVFTYRLCDADNDCAAAKVTITIVKPALVCGCDPTPDNLIQNSSFEYGMTGWYVNGGNFYTGNQYTVCGSRNAYLQRISGTARIWQDATGITAGQTLTLRAYAGTHTAGLQGNPTLSLRFIDKNGYQISAKSVSVDKDVDKPDYKLKEFVLTALVPSGTVKVRVEGSIDYNWLKLDAVCLTVTGSPVKGSIGDIVWNDVNANGIQDANEGGLSGVKVTLGNPDNTTVITTTNATGNYSFTNLLPGTYSVFFTTPSGATPSPVNAGSATADSDPVNGKVSDIVINGENKTDIDAGFYTKNCITTPLVHSKNYNFISSSYKGRATSLWVKIDIEVKKGSLSNNGDYVLFSMGSISLRNITATPMVNNAPVPNGKIIADNAVDYPITTYDAASNSWLTRVPVGFYASDVFIAGAIINSSTGFDGNNGKYSELSGVFTSNKASFTSNWSYGLSCYQSTFTYAKVAGANYILPITCRYGQWGTPLTIQNCQVYGGCDGSYYSCSGGSSDVFVACNVSNTKTAASRAIPPAKNVIEIKEFAVKASPNPSIAGFKVNIVSNSTEKITLRITDLFGRDIQVIQNVQPNTTISIGDNLKAGNYSVEAIQGTERKIVRLIKM